MALLLHFNFLLFYLLMFLKGYFSVINSGDGSICELTVNEEWAFHSEITRTFKDDYIKYIGKK